MDVPHRVAPPAWARARGSAAFALLAAIPLFNSGCASPGHPLPPSLQVPRVATGLSAAREGDRVHLRWTTPARTTDGIMLTPPITAEICREAVSSSARSPLKPATCTPVRATPVSPGPSEAFDPLPSPLAAGTPRLLAYQIQLRGSLGKTTGPSATVYSAAGAPPPPVDDLRATDTKQGALLQWAAHPAASQVVEITRERVSAPPSTSVQPRTPNPFRPRPQNTPDSRTLEPTHLSAGPVDSGGTLDRTAQLGAVYTYTAERVLTATLAAHTVVLRSSPSAVVTVTMRDSFPPAAPIGLVATPGPGSIDLSWEPGSEPGIAGYRVYRADTTSATPRWVSLTSELLTSPSYRDLSPIAGRSYSYRVTAVGSTGNESAPSPAVVETAP